MDQRIALFVDDDPEVLKIVERALRGSAMSVVTASGPEQAFEILKSVQPQVIVSDQQMPEMEGVDLLARVRELHPDIVRLMFTGKSEIGVAAEAINRGEIYRLITKPCKSDELRSALSQAFEHHSMLRELERLHRVTHDQNLRLQTLNRDLEAKVAKRTRQLAQSNRDLRVGYIHTVGALAEAVDAKDPYTRGHSERVGVYSSRIAREMDLNRELIERVYISGLLHDVGKIGIPDAILTKPDRLSDEEYTLIQTHPAIGARILESVAFLREVAPCVKHHHEWYDGSTRGYPAGLKGKDIPLPARVIAVADTVEAMTSDRPYRKARGLEFVVAEIHKYSDSQFDPRVADAFLRLIEREGETFLRKDQKFDLYAFLEA